MALIDSYSYDNYNGYLFEICGADRTYCGQCIQIGSNDYTLTAVTFFMHKWGSPTGNVYSKVWNATGTAPNMEPTGNIIAESDAKNAADLPGGTDILECEFTFSGDNQIVLNAGEKYYVACYFDGGDDSNTVGGCVDTSSPTHPGNCYHKNSGILSDTDCIFYLYGNPCGQGQAAQSFHPLAPSELTGLTAGSWQTCDVSASVPSGATGVILNLYNSSSSKYEFGLRKPGDTAHNEHADILDYAHTNGFVGVNTNREFQYYIENASYCHIYLLGYTTAGVTFLDAAVDITSELTRDVWTDYDATDITSSDATAIIIDFGGNVGSFSYCRGVRCNGSSDAYRSDGGLSGGYHCWVISKCDASQVIEVYTYSDAQKVYVIGYVTDGLEGMEVTQPDKSLSTAETWKTITVNADAKMAIFRVDGCSSGKFYGFRKDSDAPEYYHEANESQAWYVTECDDSGNCLGKASNVGESGSLYFTLIGYATTGIETISDSGSGSEEIKVYSSPTTKDATDITYDSAKLHGEASWIYSKAGFDYTDVQGSWKWSTV